LGCDPGARELLEQLVSGNTDIGSTREAVNSGVPLSAIVRSLSDLITAIATESSLLILIDDAQWIDRDSLRTIVGAFAGPATRRSYLIMAARDRALLAGIDTHSDRISSLRLNPLDNAAALELARTLLQPLTPGESDKVEQHVLEQARGNPFFIRVLCSHFTLTDERDNIRNTVTEILERRLEQLSPETTRVLEACVVLAKHCTYTRLEQLLELPTHCLLGAIEELDDRGLIEVREGCVASSHSLLSDVVVRRMSPSVFRLLHAAAAELLQRDISAVAGWLPWDCAEHWALAGEATKAISVLRACAQRAFEIGRPMDALATYRRALSLEANDSTRVELIEKTLDTFWSGINFSEAQELLAERKRLRLRIGLPAAAHDSYEMLEFASSLHSDRDSLCDATRLRECLTSEDASVTHRVHAAEQLIMRADLTVDTALAESAFESVRALRAEPIDRAFCSLLYHASFGNVQIAQESADELIDLFGEDLRRQIVLLLDVGYAQFRIGNCIDARRRLLQALAGARRNEMRSAEMYALLFLAQLTWSIEQIDESRVWHRSLTDLVSRSGATGITCDYAILGARIAIHDAVFEEARRFIDLGRACPQALADLPRMLLSACEIELQLATGGEYSDTELKDLLSLHHRARGLGGQDEVITALVRALTSRGCLRDAASLTNEYFLHRRSGGFPLRTELRRLVAELTTIDCRYVNTFDAVTN
jgi:tetratricopeptide (TPR) repeat protein